MNKTALQPDKLTFDEWIKLPEKVQQLYIAHCHADRRGSLVIDYYAPRYSAQQTAQLQAENKELREALEDIKNISNSYMGILVADSIESIATAALTTNQ